MKAWKEKYVKNLDGVEAVTVGGASFTFRQCGTHFMKDGKMYKLQVKDLCARARKAGIDYYVK